MNNDESNPVGITPGNDGIPTDGVSTSTEIDQGTIIPTDISGEGTLPPLPQNEASSHITDTTTPQISQEAKAVGVIDAGVHVPIGDGSTISLEQESEAQLAEEASRSPRKSRTWMALEALVQKIRGRTKMTYNRDKSITSMAGDAFEEKVEHEKERVGNLIPGKGGSNA